MDLLNQFKQHLQRDFPWINSQESHFVLAVSGGVDSVVLTNLFVRSGLKCSIAHCNFQLRGKESDNDAAFVKKMAAAYQLDYKEKIFDTATYVVEHKLSVQEAARELRYNWFNQIKSEITQPNFLVTAHHADDNIETVLMHFFRGTGINGLTGIKAYDKERQLLRPVLIFSKAELKAYATEKQLKYVEDSSNASDKYTRNYFRNQLLPSAETIFPSINQNILKNIERLSEVSNVYYQAIANYKRKIICKNDENLVIPINGLKKFTSTRSLVWEIIRDYQFTEPQIDEVIKLFTASNSSYIASATHRIIKERESLIVSSIDNSVASICIVDKQEKRILFSGGELNVESCEKKDISFKVKPNVLLADASLLEFPLMLRRWRTGDYFYPFGLNKKKKVSRFLIDEKLSLIEKENTWVLLSGKKIVWVVGRRVDNRFRVEEKSKQITKISFKAVAR